MIAEIFGISNVGLIRHDNQDSFLIANLETGDIATMSAFAGGAIAGDALFSFFNSVTKLRK